MCGLYIHIPFCASRCIYCDFYSTTGRNDVDRYVGALCAELLLRARQWTERLGHPLEISTIYLGGGTPTVLPWPLLQKLFDHIFHDSDLSSHLHVSDDAEVTIEANPDDVTPTLAEALAASRVNRVSLGAQSFDDERLKFLCRRHNARQIVQAVGCLKGAGMDNISLDLIFGFPRQTLSEWLSDVDRALELRPDHLSAYSLMYEEGTPLHRMLSRGQVHMLDDELQLEMYDQLIKRMHAHGYEHYEISNFCMPGRRSRHNSAYWQDRPYLGIGAAAHCYDGDRRVSNVADVSAYMLGIDAGVLDCEVEELTPEDKYNDRVVTALRTREGLSLVGIEEDKRKHLLRAARPYIDSGDLSLTDDRISLTRKGLFISDAVMRDLLWV